MFHMHRVQIRIPELINFTVPVLKQTTELIPYNEAGREVSRLICCGLEWGISGPTVLQHTY